MTETPPPRRALATFLRRPGAERPAAEAHGEPTATSASEPEPSAQPSAATALAEVSGAEAVPAPEPEDAAPQAAAEAEAAEGDLAAFDDLAPTEADAAQAEALDTTRAEATEAVNGTAAWRAAELPVVASATAPTFARKRARAPSQRAPLWQWAALTTLVLLLALQILLADRARLAADAAWRPTLNALCGVFGCTLPPWHEPTAFTMLDREVRPAPNENGALRIQASFRNDARWAQAWPWLQLSLSDADGRVIGTRVFAPAEYLGHAPEGPDLLSPGQSARIDFRVREPAAGTAAFNFEFR